MEDLSRRTVLQLLKANKVLTLEFIIYKMPSFSSSSCKQWTVCFPRLTCRKRAGFNAQQILTQILSFSVFFFYGLKRNFLKFINSNGHFVVVWSFPLHFLCPSRFLRASQQNKLHSRLFYLLIVLHNSTHLALPPKKTKVNRKKYRNTKNHSKAS